jgi:uncharacterized integral membrane protein
MSESYGQPSPQPDYQPAGGTTPAAPLPPEATGSQPSRYPGQPPAVPVDQRDSRPAGPPPGFDERGRVQRTRTSRMWIGLAFGTLLLIALIVFIAQNTNDVAIHFLGFAGHFPLALALLIAAAAGVVIALILGGLRILQLRRSLKRNAAAQAGGRGHGRR